MDLPNSVFIKLFNIKQKQAETQEGREAIEAERVHDEIEEIGG